ncbi:capsule biosynthesis protein [Paracoccus seriniphilus]|uniref:Capsular polysaccharide transport system permease protein n=1 Tax=Paracoccus seriniphilus TaxID=184748 RepID=A0A239PM78_9RHOB|nr:capsule biosynthesis protein [Paracoccus seriniphilus]WCR13520.1 capsule biosynthesis protein [Paracoccus seriniphilus]SNT68898.1 capsular polysaccharide transport system permease protein [Paracoccus seriniphilus]
MTTPPKARGFHTSPSDSINPGKQEDGVRIEVQRRSESNATGDQPRPQGDSESEQARRERFMRTDPPQDGFAGMDPDESPAPKAVDPDLEKKLQAIRDEKLTERQLRIARRIATLHQIEVQSDEEAVLRLRERGIDPSQRAALGKLLSAAGTQASTAPGRNTPALVPQAQPPSAPGTGLGPARPPLPSREALTEERRAAEIYRIQRDIARRRRRRLMMLALRLLFFIALPTLLTGLYYFRIASPLYATYSQFQIQSAESSGSSGLGSLLSGSQLATNPDSVAVQSYLTSRDAMLRLDADKGFKQAFQDPDLDPIKRLPPDATNEAAYEVYLKSVKIGYDPTEGVLDMEVIAPDPQLSKEFSVALIAYAEEQVDRMTERLRDDQMAGAIETYHDAEEKVLAAQRRVQELQQKLGVLDPVAEGTVVMNQIATLEGQLNQKQLELGQLQANPRPLQSRVAAVQGDIKRLRELIDITRSQLTEGNETRSSLAAVSGELRIAESELATRQELLAAAAAQMESARIEANKQVRYLSLSVKPVAPDEATYPKAFQNTLVAFLIFSGIYLMLSLTASILREQVST